jgi:hypothetical protein
MAAVDVFRNPIQARCPARHPAIRRGSVSADAGYQDDLAILCRCHSSGCASTQNNLQDATAISKLEATMSMFVRFLGSLRDI